jgi:hypothetical protein
LEVAISVRSAIGIAAVLAALVTPSVAGAAAPAPAGPGKTSMGKASSPKAAPSFKKRAEGWHDGAFDFAYTSDCITGDTNVLGDAWVGWYGDPGTSPKVGDVYYVRVYWGIVGDPCAGGAYVHDELFLPAGTQLAISQNNPVTCYFSTPSDNFTYAHQFTHDGNNYCPQQATAGMYGGLAFDPAGNGTQDAAWPSADGTGYMILVPVKSSTPLNGIMTGEPCQSCLEAGVWMIDGVDSPWVNPKVGVLVESNGSTAPASVTYPYPSITDVSYECPNAPAKTYCGTLHANLFNAPKTGTSYFEVGKKKGNYIYNTNGADSSFPAYAGNSSPYQQWSLDPGVTFHWRYCYVPSGGSKVCGADNTYTVQPNTVIANSTVKKKKPTKATFDFDSSPDPSATTGDTFQCSLDGGKWKSCGATSTKDPTPHATYTKLKRGSHTFKARAVDPHGNKDTTPAVAKFKI